MAGFCRNCGAKLDDEAMVCGQCGTPVKAAEEKSNANASKIEIPGMDKINPEMKSKAKKIAIIGGIVIVALIILGVVFNMISANTGYKGMINKYFKGLEKGNAESMSECLSDYLSDQYTDLEDYLDEFIDNKLDNYEREVGENPKITIEISKDSKLSDRKLDNLKEMIEQYDSSYDADDISSARRLDIKLRIKGRDDKMVDKINDVCIVKEAGNWKIIGYDMSDYGRFGIVP